jgi:DNA-binding PadR family transcriptional regulator
LSGDAVEFLGVAKKHVASELLDCAVLHLVSKKAVHGYALLGLLKERCGVVVGASKLYPLLGRLECMGYVSGVWSFAQSELRPRKLYVLTEKGFLYLESLRFAVGLFSEFLFGEDLEAVVV